MRMGFLKGGYNLWPGVLGRTFLVFSARPGSVRISFLGWWMGLPASVRLRGPRSLALGIVGILLLQTHVGAVYIRLELAVYFGPYIARLVLTPWSDVSPGTRR